MGVSEDLSVEWRVKREIIFYPCGDLKKKTDILILRMGKSCIFAA